jgi:hypothetical protein
VLAPIVCAWLLAAAGTLQAAEDDPLAQARLLYNERQFDEAIAAADEARREPARADSADLVAARAYLERFRASAAPSDLSGARERLRRLDPGGFDARERAEFIIGLGEALYFDGAPGAAAEVFNSVLGAPYDLAPDARELVLDWWASALDRDARPRSEPLRHAIYGRIRERMQDELAFQPGSSAAAYWLVAAARGQGDLDGAWDAAQAGWVRAPLASDRGAALRGDLDRLVQRGLAPERARAHSRDVDTVLLEWEQFKERWNR